MQSRLVGSARGLSEYLEWPAGTHTVTIELTPVRVLRARVLDEGGAPTAGAYVMVSREDGSRWWLRSSRRGRASGLRTDDLGEAVLHELPAERVTFYVYPPEGEPAGFQVSVDLRDPPEGVLELRPPEDG